MPTNTPPHVDAPSGVDYETYRMGHWAGWCECLDSIRASLRNYPNEGGDIEVMKEVKRIAKQAISKWYAEGQV